MMKKYDNSKDDYKNYINMCRGVYIKFIKTLGIINLLMILMILYSLNFIVFSIYSILISMILVFIASLFVGVIQYNIAKKDLMAVEKVDAIIDKLLINEEIIDFEIISKLSGISKNFLYDNQYLRKRIEDIIHIKNELGNKKNI